MQIVVLQILFAHTFILDTTGRTYHTICVMNRNVPPNSVFFTAERSLREVEKSAAIVTNRNAPPNKSVSFSAERSLSAVEKSTAADAMMLLSSMAGNKRRRDEDSDVHGEQSSFSSTGKTDGDDDAVAEEYTARILGPMIYPIAPLVQQRPSAALQMTPKVNCTGTGTAPPAPIALREVNVFTTREAYDAHFGPFHSNAFPGFKHIS